ncbi:MAG: alpha/beta hydrolase fold domain-containing protein [Janthinobacterium lividum]
MSWQNVGLSWFLRRRMKGKGQGEINVAEARALADKMWAPRRAPRDWRIHPVAARAASEGRAATVAAEWIEPASPNMVPTLSRTVLYLHGGAYLFCSPRTHRAITCALALHGLARVLAPDYRLAPEHPAPAALDDALAAYRSLLAEGVAPASIVVAGDSAGGGLALALLLALRDAGDPLPAAGVLFSPWTDLAVTGGTIERLAESDVLFDGRGVRAAARLYLAGMPDTDWRASPLYGDFTGLPPLLIQASDSEVLLDDARRVVEKARAAGVEVEFREWRGVPHAWQIFAGFLPEARVALHQAGDFIRRRARTPV